MIIETIEQFYSTHQTHQHITFKKINNWEINNTFKNRKEKQHLHVKDVTQNYTCKKVWYQGSTQSSVLGRDSTLNL